MTRETTQHIRPSAHHMNVLIVGVTGATAFGVGVAAGQFHANQTNEKNTVTLEQPSATTSQSVYCLGSFAAKMGDTITLTDSRSRACPESLVTTVGRTGCEQVAQSLATDTEIAARKDVTARVVSYSGAKVSTVPEKRHEEVVHHETTLHLGPAEIPIYIPFISTPNETVTTIIPEHTVLNEAGQCSVVVSPSKN